MDARGRHGARDEHEALSRRDARVERRRWAGAHLDDAQADHLRLSIFDKDLVSKDDPLGDARVSLAALQRGYSEEFTLVLEGKKAKKAAKKLKARFEGAAAATAKASATGSQFAAARASGCGRGASGATPGDGGRQTWGRDGAAAAALGVAV